VIATLNFAIITENAPSNLLLVSIIAPVKLVSLVKIALSQMKLS